MSGDNLKIRYKKARDDPGFEANIKLEFVGDYNSIPFASNALPCNSWIKALV